MKEEEVNQCQISEWYPKFKSVTIETHIHELPESFVHYLLDDSCPFILPHSISDDDALPNRVYDPIYQEDYQLTEDYEDEFDQPSPQTSFPDLETKVKSSIKSLGCSVFPKLNWSAPKDAAWISSSRTLNCSMFGEIVLLLRSSDSVVHDLCHAFDACVDKTSSRPNKFFLALRKWCPSLCPEMEFRCFVKGHRLVGICQRELTGFYPQLGYKKKDIRSSIQRFFSVTVMPKFELENYVFDVYVTRQGRVKLIDFNPWGAFTLPLLFKWEELDHNLKDEDSENVEFRIIESQCAVRPSLITAVPYDYLDTSPGSGWDQFLRNAEENSSI